LHTFVQLRVNNECPSCMLTFCEPACVTDIPAFLCPVMATVNAG
jgi:hypothetical protein